MKPCNISALIPDLHILNNRAKIFAANSALKEYFSLPVATNKSVLNENQLAINVKTELNVRYITKLSRIVAKENF